MSQSDLLSAVAGTLRSSPPSGIAVQIRFYNMLTGVTVQVIHVDDQGNRSLWCELQNREQRTIDTFKGVAYEVRSVVGGAIICAGIAPAPPPPDHVPHWDLMIHPYQFTQPNQIGGPPKSHTGADSTMIIPPNGARVLVGHSVANWGVILRVQYWERSPESISLAPGQKKVIFSSQQAGTTWSSSSEKTLSEAASLSAGVGIGAFSISASGSVSNSSTTGFSTTEESDTETQVETKVQNTLTHDVTAFEWRLIDETLLVNNGKCTASYAVALSPSIIEILEFGPVGAFLAQLELARPEERPIDHSGLIPGELGDSLFETHTDASEPRVRS